VSEHNIPKSIPLYSGLAIDSVESLEEVLRLLDSLQDLEPRPMPGISRFRVNETLNTEKKIHPLPGRRFFG
jgi:hypothetical protein